jgi:hypothetical protein
MEAARGIAADWGIGHLEHRQNALLGGHNTAHLTRGFRATLKDRFGREPGNIDRISARHGGFARRVYSFNAKTTSAASQFKQNRHSLFLENLGNKNPAEAGRVWSDAG